MPPKVVPLYRCTEAELYAIATTLASNLQNHLPDFAAFKTFYTPAFVANFRSLIQDAVEYPTFQARNADSESLRIQLKEKAHNVCRLWRSLDRYIADAFSPNAYKALRESAGYLHYRRAYQCNWEFVSALAIPALHFINNHSSQLSAAGTLMPPSFPAAFASALSDFDSTYRLFMSKRQSREGTVQKITRNNKVYTICANICKDSKIIHKYHAGVRAKFTFSRLLVLVSSQ